VVGAQQSQVPVVGILSVTSAKTAWYLNGFHEGLKKAGYVEGQNIAIELRFAEGRYDRLPAMAAELVRRPNSLTKREYGRHRANRKPAGEGFVYGE
jgi:putative ABC transport system substrate-binding protein